MKKKKRKLKKWFKIALIILILVISFFILFIVHKISKNKDIDLISNLNIEINSEVYIEDLIKDSKEEITNKNEQIDTKKLGNKEVTITYIKDDELKEYTITVNIIDTISPTIDVEGELALSINSSTDIKNLISISDNSGENIIPVIEGDYDVTKIGEYKITIKATDSSNNLSSKEVTLRVLDNKVAYNSDGSLKDGIYGTAKGYIVKVENSIATVDGNIIVNKTYSLPSTYEPKSPYVKIYAAYCKDCIEDYVMEAFLEMQRDAAKEGLTINIGSGYRSYDTQITLYNNYVSEDGKEAADTYSARAGYSEHQSGLCFDIYPNRPSFTNTEAGKWVNKNAYKYGLVIRFPEGKEEYTGYTYESWHLRYVGKELAQILYNNGDWISLEEYYGLSSIYPD